MLGSDTIECQHDGTWTKAPFCLQRCDIPNIRNLNVTNISESSFKDSSSLKISCNENSMLIGNSTMKCSNGTWIDPPTCRIYKCDNPLLEEHVTIAKVPVYHVNKSYELNCSLGHHETSKLSARCNQSGEWELEGGCSIDHCGIAPNVSFSSHNGSLDFNHTYLYKDILVYS